MNLDEQIKVVENVIDDLKGENVVTINVMKQSDDMEAIIIATGKSIQHARGIANNVSIEAKRLNMMVLGTEGAEFSEWILVDLGEVIVHIMTEKTREFYKLEKLWTSEDEED
jgi:ribosome-associated protein